MRRRCAAVGGWPPPSLAIAGVAGRARSRPSMARRPSAARPSASHPPGPDARRVPDLPGRQRVEPGRQQAPAAPAKSAAIIAQIQADGGDNLHPDFGENPDYGIPFVVVPASQPLVPITYTAYGDESDPGPFPIPLDAPVEGGGAGGDRHVLVLRQGTCELFELFVGFRNGAGWSAASRRPLRPHVERAAPARLDERRRRRPADPARPRALRRGRRRRDPPRDPRHVRARPSAATSCRPRTSRRRTRPTRTVPPMGLRLRLKRVVRHVARSPARRG